MFSKTTLGRLTLGLFLLFLPLAGVYATAGCCSHHGGVVGCNSATNHEACKDGTTSPTCLCTGGTAAKPKKTTSSTSTTSTTTSGTTGTQSSTTTNTNSTTTTAATPAKSTKGCCAKHGGVASCDKASGYQMCKDGTRSSSCKC